VSERSNVLVVAARTTITRWQPIPAQMIKVSSDPYNASARRRARA